jgi:hypothetical protein
MVKENKYEGNVVDNGGIVNGPTLVGQLQQGRAALLQAAFLVVGHHQLQHLVVVDELPHSVRCQQDEAITILEL